MATLNTPAEIFAHAQTLHHNVNCLEAFAARLAQINKDVGIIHHIFPAEADYLSPDYEQDLSKVLLDLMTEQFFVQKNRLTNQFNNLFPQSL